MGLVEGNGISLERCRQMLGATGKDVSDDQVARLRDDLYNLASIAVTLYEREGEADQGHAVLDEFPVEDRESIEERAAVLEFDAGMTRSAATRTAVASHIRATTRKNPASG